ncbi:MAG: hypothetical protein NDJ90_07590 [Oligoflexia bacterium]|nr:hypothetical protein [Oligoflexia bacterium]
MVRGAGLFVFVGVALFLMAPASQAMGKKLARFEGTYSGLAQNGATCEKTYEISSGLFSARVGKFQSLSADHFSEQGREECVDTVTEAPGTSARKCYREKVVVEGETLKVLRGASNRGSPTAWHSVQEHTLMSDQLVVTFGGLAPCRYFRSTSTDAKAASSQAKALPASEPAALTDVTDGVRAAPAN